MGFTDGRLVVGVEVGAGDGLMVGGTDGFRVGYDEGRVVVGEVVGIEVG